MLQTGNDMFGRYAQQLALCGAIDDPRLRATAALRGTLAGGAPSPHETAGQTAPIIPIATPLCPAEHRQAGSARRRQPQAEGGAA